MNSKQFNELVEYIHKNHSFGKLSKNEKRSKHIKYVDSTLDMRNGKIFSVTLRGVFDDITFTTNNENTHRDLFTWIMDWLEK